MADDREQLLGILANQRRAVRGAVAGLSEEQLRATPSANAMSLGSLLKHVTTGEHRGLGVQIGGLPDGGDPVQEWQSGWVLADGETRERLLARYADAAEQTESIVRAVDDLDAAIPLPAEVRHRLPAGMAITARGFVLHSIEETARHAGHADIIRESLDGTQARNHLPEEAPPM